jgi:hypothetical protein
LGNRTGIPDHNCSSIPKRATPSARRTQVIRR